MKRISRPPFVAAAILARQKLPPRCIPAPDEIDKEITVVNPYGLHLRPVAMLVRLTSQFDCDVSTSLNGNAADGKSAMQLLALGAAKGATLRIRTAGSDAREAMQQIERLIQWGFDEDLDSPEPATHSAAHQKKPLLNGKFTE